MPLKLLIDPKLYQNNRVACIVNRYSAKQHISTSQKQNLMNLTAGKFDSTIFSDKNYFHDGSRQFE